MQHTYRLAALALASGFTLTAFAQSNQRGQSSLKFSKGSE